MKILTSSQIKEADKFTIENEPISSINLMERASVACVDWILKNTNEEYFYIFVGQGNNGGDGLAIARLLSHYKKNVTVFCLKFSNSETADFKTNLERIKRIRNVEIVELSEFKNIDFLENSIIIDAIFGSGYSPRKSEFFEKIVNQINQSKKTVISIDIPSGLSCDDYRKDFKNQIIKANTTLTFQFPKLSFLFPENGEFVGNFEVLDIGLHQDYLSKVETQNFYLQKEDFEIKKREKFSHKGIYGNAFLFAGSEGKMGAAILSAKSCLRSGVGLISVLVPKSENYILQIALPEAMTFTFENDNIEVSKFSAIGIGPGIGTSKETADKVLEIIKNTKVPLIIDADGLNILSENKNELKILPENTILTPHVKEFERLFGKTNNDFERFLLQKEMSAKFKISIVLKGAHTIISHPNGNCYFNSTGNPGMATGGSGDVLTGIILSLLAQHFEPNLASTLGVFIHGLAGDFAKQNSSEESIIASDIIENLGKTFNLLKISKYD